MEKTFQYKPTSVQLVSKLMLLGILLLIGEYSYSQTVKDSLKHHVIVLLDRSGSVDRKIPESTAKRMIENHLKKVCFSKGVVPKNFLVTDRSLLEKGDYLSVLSFGFDKDNPDVDDFIQRIPFQNKAQVTLEDGYNQKVFSSLWDQIESIGYKRFFNKNWTGLSFAAAHAIQSLKAKGNPKDVGKTFVIIITDGEFNGLGDPNLELEELSNFWDDNNVTVKNHKKIIPKYNDIKKTFIWNKIYAYSSNPYNNKKNYKIEVIEYNPLQQTFAIEAVVPLESKLLFKRTPTTYYKNDFKLSINKNSPFQVERMNLQLKDTVKNKIVWTKDFYKIYNSTTIPLEVSKTEKDKNLIVEAKFWVHYDDGSYGVHMLYPNGDVAQGSKGLQRNIFLVFEKSDRLLFGIIPLFDSLYELSSKLVGEDQGSNIIFWNLLILLILVALAFITIKIKTTIN